MLTVLHCVLCAKSFQSCLTLCNPMNCSLPGSAWSQKRCMLKDNFKNHRPRPSGANVSEERFSSLPFQWGSLDTSTTPRLCATGKTSSSTSTASPPSTPLPAAPTTTTTTTRASARTLSPVSCERRAGASPGPRCPRAMTEVDSQRGHASHLETPGERHALIWGWCDCQVLCLRVV